MTKLLIQVYSDLHIELMKNFPRLKPTAKYLFLVGDICQLNHPLFFKFFETGSSAIGNRLFKMFGYPFKIIYKIRKYSNYS